MQYMNPKIRQVLDLLTDAQLDATIEAWDQFCTNHPDRTDDVEFGRKVITDAVIVVEAREAARY